MKNPTEEPAGIYLSLKSWDISLALNMTYFFFYVILNDSEGSHRRTDEAYTFSLKSWDISLTLNMTYFLSPIVGIADDRGFTLKIAYNSFSGSVKWEF